MKDEMMHKDEMSMEDMMITNELMQMFMMDMGAASIMAYATPLVAAIAVAAF